MKAALLIADGFEDAEAVIIYDILRRLHIDVALISCAASGRLAIKSYFSLSVHADDHINNLALARYNAVIIPGGPDSTMHMAADPQVINFIRRHDEWGEWVCALCSAPARVLGNNLLLRNRRYTCSGDLWMQCPEGTYTGENVVIDGNLITGKGLGVAFEFAFAVAEKLLKTPEPGQRQANHIYFNHPV